MSEVDESTLMNSEFNDPNQYNILTQTGYHYNMSMTKSDFPIDLETLIRGDKEKGIPGYDWSHSTVNSMCAFTSYLKSMAVLLANYDTEKEMREAILDVEIAFHKATLLCNHADTNTAEFITFKDLAFRYLRDRASRSRGSNRERILQGLIRQILDQNVTQELKDNKSSEQRKKSWLDRLRRNNNQEE